MLPNSLLIYVKWRNEWVCFHFHFSFFVFRFFGFSVFFPHIFDLISQIRFLFPNAKNANYFDFNHTHWARSKCFENIRMENSNWGEKKKRTTKLKLFDCCIRMLHILDWETSGWVCWAFFAVLMDLGREISIGRPSVVSIIGSLDAFWKLRFGM